MASPYHLIRFEGLLDISRYPEFRTAFEAVPRAVPVLVDLTTVESVDSTFLTELMLLERRHGAKVVVVIVPVGHVARIFEITNLGAKLAVQFDLGRAIDSMGLEREPCSDASVNAG
jgi:anti-anti-sigma regulatory factor